MRVLGPGQRSAGILPASICRQDGGAPALPNLVCADSTGWTHGLGYAPVSTERAGSRFPVNKGAGSLKRGPCRLTVSEWGSLSRISSMARIERAARPDSPWKRP